MFKLRSYAFLYRYSCFSKNLQYAQYYAPTSILYLNKKNYIQNNINSENVQQSKHLYLYSTTSGVVDRNNVPVKKEITHQLYDIVCEETLESLTEFFEEMLDTNPKFSTADISYSVSIYYNNNF